MARLLRKSALATGASAFAMLSAMAGPPAAIGPSNNAITTLQKFGRFSIIASGAICDAYTGNTDNTNALRAWFPTIGPGSTIDFGSNKCLHTDDITLPPGVHFISTGVVPGGFNQGGAPQGGGFVHPGTAHVFGSFSDTFDNIGIWRSQDGCFHVGPGHPTIAEELADRDCWWNDESQGITFPQVTGSPTSHGIHWIGGIVEGYRWGIYDQAAQVDIDDFKGDNIVNIAEFGVGDKNTIHRARSELYYSGSMASTPGARQGRGVGYYFNGGGGYNAKDLQCEDQPMCVVAESISGNFDIIQWEYSAIDANSPVGHPAENYGIGVHIIGNTNGTSFHKINANSNNQNATPLLFGAGVQLDAAQYMNTYDDINLGFIPAGGVGFYGSGITASPVTEQITALPSVGSPVSLTVGGSTLAAFGGPYTVTHKVTAADTPASVALALDALWNTQYSAPAFAHIPVLTQLFPAGTFGVYYNQEQSITVSVSGATVVSTNPWAASTSYSAGATVNSGFNIYAAASSCVSGGGPAPVGLGSGISDGVGGCSWNFVSGSHWIAGSSGILKNVKTTGNNVVTTWAPSTSYTGGSPDLSTVFANGNIYVETAPTCTSGSTAPAGTSSGISDGSGGCTWNYVRAGDAGQTRGDMIRLGNSTFGAGSWLIDDYFFSIGLFPLNSNWLGWAVPPSSLHLGNIQWSPVFQANLNGTGGGATVGANSFDDVGTLTIPAGQTADLTWSTRYPAAPFCGVWGGPVANVAPTATDLQVTNPGPSTNTYEWMCKVAVHQ